MPTTIKKVSLLFFICLIPFSSSSVSAGWDDPVNFDCIHLQMAVEDELGVYDPTEEDMQWLTSITYKECTDLGDLFDAEACDYAITDLSGLEYAHNLKSIDFHLNKITSISPLKNLTQLEDVRLGRNYIHDLGPLKDLTKLTYLDVHGNGLSDLSPLSGLTDLQTLKLRWNNISDASPLSGLSKLRALHIHGNMLSDISPLSGLTSLTTLYIYDNQVSDISALSGLINLSLISAPNNQIGDISALAGLPKLSALYLHYNQISDILPLAGLTRLTKLNLLNNPLDQQACDIYPQIIANNPGMISFDYKPCLSGYGLTISSSSGGSVSTPGEGIFTYDHDSAVSVTATAQSNHHFVNWTGTAATAGKIANPSSHSITIAVDGRYTLKANFAEEQSGRPSVSTYAAGDLTETSARLTGYLVDDGAKACEGWFCFWIKGRQAQTEQSTSKQPSLQKSQQYVKEVNGLLPGTTYCFQAVVENSDGQNEGTVREFSTLDAVIPAANLIHVDDNAINDPGPHDRSLSDPQEDGTEGHPYDSIQEAIELAQDLDKILVHEGSYYETLNLMGKCLHISRFAPDAVDIAPYPVIDAQHEGRVVTFNKGEDPGCILSGFVLTGGLSHMGSAIACIGASPTIKNCLIIGNRSSDPAGATIYCEQSYSVLENCTISDNDAGEDGAVLYSADCNLAITNSIIWDNRPEQVLVESGNDPMIVYTDVQGSWPGVGNTDSAPLFARPGYWADPHDPDLGPTEPDARDAIWIQGDYHLLSKTGRYDPDSLAWILDEFTSPCIDAGDPDSLWTGESKPNGARLNMGTYGGTDQASYSPRVIPIVAHWAFDESSGTTAYDAVGDRHGTVHGAIWTKGILDGALTFDGLDDYVDCGNDPALAPNLFTISLWVHAQAGAGSRSILRKAGSDKDYELKLFAARNPTFSFGDGSQSMALYSSSDIPLNEWVHITLTRDKAEAMMYVNGIQVASMVYDFAPSATDHKLIIGGGSLQPYRGIIDDVQIYDSVLSAEEVERLVREAE
jgi:hypothetical protein